jgi:hypothetical protein
MNAGNVTSEGPLYELISRGNKDVYFISDDASALFPYDNRYEPQPALIHELRRIPPLQATEFGRSIEFQFEIAGDVVIEPTLVIDLPTWLPEAQAALNGSSVITDLSDVSYGYTRGIGYFLFEKIQFFQDRLLLQEWSGDELFAITRSRGSLGSAFLENALTGVHDGSDLAIQRNATPGRLRLALPLVGCQSADDGGFPRICATEQAFRVRCVLRKLEDLVEASDGRAKPTPWSKDFQIQTSVGVTAFTTIGRLDIPSPVIQLETRHIYTDRETQDTLRTSVLTVPFERHYENNFTQGQIDYAPLSRGGTAFVSRRLDGEHPAVRSVMSFRTETALQANQRWSYTSNAYTALALIIAGRDRETSWSSLVWHELVQHAKEERDSGYSLSFMNWSLGDLVGRNAPFARQLEGSINFTTADRPTLLITLAALPGTPNTFLDVYVETWAALEFEEGRSALLFGN